MTPEELADAHWEYLKERLKIHGEYGSAIELIEYHYKTAMIHGYKHGQEDAQKVFRP